MYMSKTLKNILKYMRCNKKTSFFSRYSGIPRRAPTKYMQHLPVHLPKFQNFRPNGQQAAEQLAVASGHLYHFRLLITTFPRSRVTNDPKGVLRGLKMTQIILNWCLRNSTFWFE